MLIDANWMLNDQMFQCSNVPMCFSFIYIKLYIRGCPHITSANFGGCQTPPPPLVSNRQQLPAPPSPPRQQSSAFGRPRLYQWIQGKHTFWYEIVMVLRLFRTERQLLNKVGLICLVYTHICHFLTHFSKFFSDSTPPRQQSSAFGLPPLPPSSAMVSIWLTPPPPFVSNRQHLPDPLPPLRRLT